MNSEKLLQELLEVQKRARIRKLTEKEMLAEAKIIEIFLYRSPIGTSVKTCWPRLPNAYTYNYKAKATFVYGLKAEDGIEIKVLRGNSFGNRFYVVHLPKLYKIVGDGTHWTGAADFLDKAKIVERI